MSYPLITKMTYNEKYNQYKMQKKMYEGFQSETGESMEKNDREIFIDFRTKPAGEFKIKIKNLKERDEKVKERVKPWDDKHLNVLRIFIDTLSRANFHRKYRYTKKFLNKYNFKNQASSRLYEYFRLHSVKSYTYPNLVASSYGIPGSGYDGPRKRVSTYARESGYITGYSSDYCSICEGDANKRKLHFPQKFKLFEISNFLKILILVFFLIFFQAADTPWEFNDEVDHDHIFTQISCDYNLRPKEGSYSFGLSVGPYTACRNCFMKQDLGVIVLDYAYEFFETYKNDRKYFQVRIISAHEFTGENNWYVDVELARFLKKFESSGHLNNTLLMVYSDHGDHIDYFLWSTISGYAEMVNPFMFVVVPEALDRVIGKNLRANQQRLISHYEIFRSVVKYFGREFDKNVIEGPNIFYMEVPKRRTCIDALVNEECRCFPKI